MKKLLLFFGAILALQFQIYGQTIWEDFEDEGKLTWEDRNGLFNGIIANPDTTGLNTSANVGSYTKEGGRGFSLFLSELESPIDLTTERVWKLQVWSPIQTEVLLKLEGEGPAIEDRRQITEDSTWVEYSFDFTGADAALSATRIIIFFAPGTPEDSSTYLFDNLIAEPLPENQVLEDFETGGTLPWEAVNGSFAVVENPTTDGINTSDSVGAYTKEMGRAFSLFRAQSPIDLSILNRVGIQINAPIKSEFILKFEGNGPAIERRVNIPTANVWREYMMDFSTAELKNFTQVLIFFDPGEADSEDTYLFDNLTLYPADECAGTEIVTSIIDDFECQRNATYDNGWDRLAAVANPDQSEGNTSSTVGEYNKPLGQAFAALVADYDNPIDLSELNQITAKIWSPNEGRILFKLEGGASPAQEVSIDVPSVNQWVTYSADFSASALEDHKRIVIFFGAGEAVESETIYYVDDIQLEAKTSSVLEDFEVDTNFVWLPLNGDATNHGVWSVIDNPDASGVNTSTKVGSYVKGAAAISTLSAILVEPLDLSTFSQINIQLWAPEGATNARMQLVSATQGNSEVTRDITATGEWTDLQFNFEDFLGVTDASQINFIFDEGVAITEPYFIDNISLGEGTVDPCEGMEVDDLVIDDFECQRNVPITLGAEDILAVPNPDIGAGNQSTIVGKYTEPDDSPWRLILYDYGDDNPIDLSVFNQLQSKIWSPRVVPILFKLEGGSGPATEIFMDVPEAETWVDYSIDFSGLATNGYTRVAIFFNAGQAATPGEEFFIDGIQWGRAPYDGCMSDYETETSSVLGWQYFANGVYGGGDSTIRVVPNPAKDDVNGSDFVAEFVEAAGDGEMQVRNFAGAFTRLDAYVEFPDPDNKIVRAKVWMEEAGRVVFKLEGSQTGEANSGDIFTDYTTPGQWQEVSWDFNAFPTGARYAQIAFIPDFDVTPTAERRSYFDDITIGATADCGTTVSIFNTQKYDDLRVFPNPTSNWLHFENSDDLVEFRIFNAIGQNVKIIKQRASISNVLDVSELQNGVYTVMAFDANRIPQARAKFVKL